MMIDGQSEQQNGIKKAMKKHEIISSDKKEFAECKTDLMKKLAMEPGEAEEIANSIRDMFLPKLLKSEGLSVEEMPTGFVGKMTDNDDNFADRTLENNDEHDDTSECCIEDRVEDAHNDESGVGEDEIATIHITAPANKITEVENALKNVLSGPDAQSEDHAIGHKDKQQEIGENDMNKKEIEARMELRKTILAAMADDEEVQSVTRVDHFDHDKSEQYKEEEFFDTKKGDLTDPDFKTLDYAKNEIPNYTTLVTEHLMPDLGLHETLSTFKFDGTPENSEEFTLDFAPFPVPSQGDEELSNEFPIPSEGKLPHKRTINSSTLGEFNADAAEEVLAFALKTAGVEDEDLGKLTYAEALELFTAIRTASEDREHYGKDGKMVDTFNQPKDPDHKKVAVTEDLVREHSESEDDKEADHTRKELYSSTDAYANMLKKLMKGASEDDLTEAKTEVTTPGGEKVELSQSENEAKEAEMEKSAELYKARLKTAYAMSNKLALAGLLPANELDAYAEGMLSDGLTVTAMIRQTKLNLNLATANAEKYASANAMQSVRTAQTGTSFNPTVRGASADLSGVSEIQYALKNLGWTAPKVDTGMED